MPYYFVIKKKNLLLNQAKTWKDFICMLLSDGSQSEKVTVLFYLCDIAEKAKP